MIIDAFPFYNEFDMLKSRLQYLGEHVDKFIIIESTIDFSGQSKRINLTRENTSNLPFNKKIITCIYDPYLINKHLCYPFAKLINWRKLLWKIQHNQRDAILKGLKDIPEDAIVIFGDVDEFPNKDEFTTIDKVVEPGKIYTAIQEMFYYNLETRHIHPWFGTTFCRLNTFRNTTPSVIRHKRIDHIKKFTGWHFSYFMNSADIKNKIKIISGAENLKKYNDLNESQISQTIENGHDLFSRKDVALIKTDHSNLPIGLRNILNNNFQYLFENRNNSK